MKIANGLEEYRQSGEYVRVRKDVRQHILPHQAWRSLPGANHNRGLLVGKRNNQDWAFNINAVQFIYDLEKNGKIDKGYVLFEDVNLNVMAVHTITDVWNAVHTVEPQMGEWGPFVFLDINLAVREPGEWSEVDPWLA